MQAKNLNGNNLHQAVLEQDLDSLQQLLNDNPQLIHETNTDGYTPMNLAAAKQKWDAVIQIANSVNTNEVDSACYGKALLFACIYNHTDAAKSLIQAGAPTTYLTGTNASCLHWAVYHRNADLALTLLENGADAKAQDCFGQAALAEKQAAILGLSLDAYQTDQAFSSTSFVSSFH